MYFRSRQKSESSRLQQRWTKCVRRPYKLDFVWKRSGERSQPLVQWGLLPFCIIILNEIDLIISFYFLGFFITFWMITNWLNTFKFESKFLNKKIVIFFSGIFQVNDFPSENVSSYPNSLTEKVGHYTQVIWAKTQKVGCGFIQASNPETKIFFTVFY